MRTFTHPLRAFGAALVLSSLAFATASADPAVLPRAIGVGQEYVFGLPSGKEMRCSVLSEPVGQWVRCRSTATQQEVWINLGAVAYVLPPTQ